MNEKIIDNIKPYNDIFYNNCFYSSFFPIVEHFNQDIMHFLVNDMIIYSLNNRDNMLCLEIEYAPSKQIDELLNDISLSWDKRSNSEHIIEDIILSVQKDIPVIIWVDCFYESIRKDTYMKLHWPHSWLIFGFNITEKTFYTIEHNHKEYLTYDTRKISFEDTINSYNGFKDNFQNEFNIDSYFTFCEREINTREYETRQSLPTHMTTFLTNMNKKKSETLHGLEHLAAFINHVEQVISSDELGIAEIERLVSIVNNIVKAKQVEKYRLSKFPCNFDEKCELMEEIIKNWDSIRTIMAKTMYSHCIKKNSAIALISKLVKVHSLEYRYYSSFTS